MTLTYRRMAALARAQAARLDRLGVPTGGRVAFISQNSARLLTSFFGVSGWGRTLVPINFRLSAAEIVLHRRTQRRRGRLLRPGTARAARLVVRPAQVPARRRRRPVPARHRAAAVGRPRRGGHRHHQLHLRHHRPPQGRAADPPQLVAQRDGFRPARDDQRPRRLPAHAADVPRQRLGHALRHDRGRRPAHRAAQGRRRRDPAPDRTARRHPDVRGARRWSPPRSMPRARGTARSPAATGCGSSSPALPHRPAPSSGCWTSSAGSSSRSTASPRPPRWSP